MNVMMRMPASMGAGPTAASRASRPAPRSTVAARSRARLPSWAPLPHSLRAAARPFAGGGDGRGDAKILQRINAMSGNNDTKATEGGASESKIIPDAIPFRNDPTAPKTGAKGISGLPDRNEAPAYEYDGVQIPVAIPRFSYFFFASNFIVYGCLAITGLLFGDRQFDSLVAALANNHSSVWDGDYGRLLTSNWLFPGWISLTLNSLALTQVGPEVEALFGYTRYNYIAVLVGIAGAVASCATNTADVTYGGPGMLVGLIGALSVYVIRHGPPKWLVSQVVFVLGVMVYDVYCGSSGVDGVDSWGTFGSLAAGVLLAWGLGPSWEVLKIKDATASEPSGVAQDTIKGADQFSFGISFVVLLAILLAGTSPSGLSAPHLSDYWVSVFN